jgi:uncharacterized protein (DUF2249 family)
MNINANTRIAVILKQRPEALEVIIGISPKFEKLRNPFLRKLMAGRTSIAMASKLGGCAIADFFTKLKPLGFEVDDGMPPAEEEKKHVPGFMATLNEAQLIVLDVRPVIASGKDPLSMIIEKVKTIHAGQVLKIINSFEPTPLMHLLEKQGFESFADMINDELVETWFYKKMPEPLLAQPVVADAGWDAVLAQYKSTMQVIDVRALKMPQPMLTILDALDRLEAGTALFVYHKRIPVFLLPELTERKFGYRIKEISDAEVHLLIFRN